MASEVVEAEETGVAKKRRNGTRKCTAINGEPSGRDDLKLLAPVCGLDAGARCTAASLFLTGFPVPGDSAAHGLR